MPTISLKLVAMLMLINKTFFTIFNKIIITYLNNGCKFKNKIIFKFRNYKILKMSHSQKAVQSVGKIKFRKSGTVCRENSENNFATDCTAFLK